MLPDTDDHEPALQLRQAEAEVIPITDDHEPALQFVHEVIPNVPTLHPTT